MHASISNSMYDFMKISNAATILNQNVNQNYNGRIPVIFDINKFAGNLLMGSWPTMSDKEQNDTSDWKTKYFDSVVSDKNGGK